MKRVDQEATQYLKAAVYGPGGSGKTNLGVTAHKPLILLSESQGLLHVRQAAIRLGVPCPPTIQIETVADYRNILRAMHGDKTKPFRVFQAVEGSTDRELVFELEEWPETAVLDSLTDAARIIVEGIREESPPKAGSDGLPVDSKRFWGALEDRLRGMITAFRDAPLHTLFLCLEDDREHGDEDARVRRIVPKLPMKAMPSVLCAAVNVMGYSYRREVRQANKPTETQFAVMFNGPETHLLKGCAPLRDRERPRFDKWTDWIIKGVAVDGGLPAPSGESTLGLAPVDGDALPEAPKESPEGKPKKKKKNEGEPQSEPAGGAADAAAGA